MQQNQEKDSLLKVIQSIWEPQKDSEKKDSEKKEQLYQQQKQQQSQSGQLVINYKDEGTVTALAFNTYKDNQLVVAGEKMVKFYDVAFNQGGQFLENQNVAAIIYNFEKVLGNDKITAIHFPQTTNAKQPFFIGTKKGNFICALLVPLNFIYENLIDLHKGQISCIQQVWNKEELVILTGSYDSEIKQFTVSVNTDFKVIPEKDQTKLKHGSTEGVFWLSLSEPEKTKQRLISSGYENNFYIWERNTDSFEWQFILKYKRNAFGARVAYFGSDFIVWQMFKQNYVNILLNLNTSKLSNEEVAQNLKPENIRKAQVNEQYDDNKIERYDTDKFPLLYNKKKEIMAIKYGNRIYFLLCKRQQPSKEGSHNTAQLFQAKPELSFNYLQEFIQCSLDCTEGAISPVGDKLAVYDSCKKEVIIYRLWFLENLM